MLMEYEEELGSQEVEGRCVVVHLVAKMHEVTSTRETALEVAWVCMQ